jgi:quercetin dioxygenase-like cupin family protein
LHGIPVNFAPMQAPSTPVVVLPREAPVFEAFGDRAVFHLTGAQTGGRYTMFSSETAPGCGPPPHWHEKDDEWFLVVEGQAEFFKDGEWTAVPVGSAVFVPHGTVHAFRNVGETPLKQIIHVSPSGFETFFERCAVEFRCEGGPDMAAVMGIAAEHGIHFAH